MGIAVSGETDIASLTTGVDGTIYDGTKGTYRSGHGGHFFYYNPPAGPFTGTLSDLGKAVSGEGDIYSLTPGTGDGVYGGTARNGHLFLYQPPPVVVKLIP